MTKSNEESNCLIRSILKFDHSLLEKLASKLDPSEMGYPQGKSLIIGLSESIRDLDEHKIKQLVVSLNNHDIEAVVEIYGGQVTVMSNMNWLSSVPGLTSDSSKATEYLSGAVVFAKIMMEKINLATTK